MKEAKRFSVDWRNSVRTRPRENVKVEREENVAAVFRNEYPSVSSCYTAHAKKQGGHVSVREGFKKKKKAKKCK